MNGDRPSTASVVSQSGPPSLITKIFKSKRVRLLSIISLLIIGFFANEGKQTTSYLVVGGCIGLISSVRFYFVKLS